MNKWTEWLGVFAVVMALTLTGCGGDGGSGSEGTLIDGGTDNDGGSNNDGTGETPVTLSVTVVPGDGSTGVAVNAVVVATFNQDMDPATLNDTTVYLTSDGSTHIAGNLNYVTKILTFKPAENLAADTTYQFVISTDAATSEGGHFETPQITTFSTGEAALVSSRGVTVSMAPAALSIDSAESQLLAPVTGALLGTSVELDLLQWQQLADAEIGFDDLLSGIENEVGSETLDTLLQNSLSLDSFLGILSNLLNQQGASGAEAVIEQLRTAANGAGTAALPVPLAKLLQLPAGISDISVENLVALLQSQSGGISTLSLLGTLNGIIEPLATAPVEVALSLPPLLESSVKIQTMAPPAVALLAEGESLHGSATRAYMDLAVGGEDVAELANLLSGITATVTDNGVVNSLLDLTGSLLGGLLRLDELIDLGDYLDPAGMDVSLPLYLELGSANAKLTQLAADGIDMSVTTGAARLYLGKIDESVFFTREALDASDFEPVEIVNVLGLISVSVKGYAAAESGTQAMHFLPIDTLQTQTAFNPAGTNVDSLLASLLANLEFQIDVLGITVSSSDLAALQDTLNGVLAQTLMPIAGNLLDTVSELLGVYVGSAEVSVLGVVE